MDNQLPKLRAGDVLELSKEDTKADQRLVDALILTHEASSEARDFLVDVSYTVTRDHLLEARNKKYKNIDVKDVRATRLTNANIDITKIPTSKVRPYLTMETKDPKPPNLRIAMVGPELTLAGDQQNDENVKPSRKSKRTENVSKVKKK